MEHPQAILFDLDDTIVDFTGKQRECWERACRLAVRRLPGVGADALFERVTSLSAWHWSDPDRHAAGRRDLRSTSAAIVDLAFEHLGLRAPEGLGREIADHYRDLREAGLSLFPGAVATLEALRSSGVALALVTNGSAREQRAKIERFDLGRHFDHVQIEGEFGLGKPDEAVYRAALDALGVAPTESAFVGDHPEWDVAAPQRLGIYGVWVAGSGSRRPPAGCDPDRIVGGIGELLADAPHEAAPGRTRGRGAAPTRGPAAFARADGAGYTRSSDA